MVSNRQIRVIAFQKFEKTAAAEVERTFETSGTPWLRPS